MKRRETIKSITGLDQKPKQNSFAQRLTCKKAKKYSAPKKIENTIKQSEHIVPFYQY